MFIIFTEESERQTWQQQKKTVCYALWDKSAKNFLCPTGLALWRPCWLRECWQRAGHRLLLHYIILLSTCRIFFLAQTTGPAAHKPPDRAHRSRRHRVVESQKLLLGISRNSAKMSRRVRNEQTLGGHPGCKTFRWLFSGRFSTLYLRSRGEIWSYFTLVSARDQSSLPWNCAERMRGQGRARLDNPQLRDTNFPAYYWKLEGVQTVAVPGSGTLAAFQTFTVEAGLGSIWRAPATACS